MKSSTVYHEKISLSRRDFLKQAGLAAGGLIVAFHFQTGNANDADSPSKDWAANAFIHIAPDGQITVLVPEEELGQGVFTSLSMLVAEELDADWTKITVQAAPVISEPEYASSLFANLLSIPDIRMTGGSLSITVRWEQLRTAGAKIRMLLINVAAKTWGVEPASLCTESSQVIHNATNQRLDYGSLIKMAAKLPIPENVTLKKPDDFRIIGRDMKRVEAPEKVTGRAKYSIDVQLPSMLTAVVAHPPVYGDKVKHYRAEEALKMPGVVRVKFISSGVAVIAKDFWTAKTARDKLNIEWESGPATGLNSREVQEQYRELATQPGNVIKSIGDVDVKLKKMAKTIEATYEVPYLAHACMEPLNCVAQDRKTSGEIWVGTQMPSEDQATAARILGLKPTQVKVNNMLAGGSFGRRLNRDLDFVTDAVEVAKGENVPIKTIWAREQDIQGGYYRPMFTHKLIGGLNQQRKPEVWLQRLVGQSIYVGTLLSHVFIKDGVDISGTPYGAAELLPYAIPNRRIEAQYPTVPVPVLWWRSVHYSHAVFASECFVDEIAHAGGHDPIDLRRALLIDRPQHERVMELAVAKAGWDEPLPKGRGRGVAINMSHGSYVAQIAEVSVTSDREIKVHKVICAIDCGTAVNPLGVKAQIEGAIIFGLTAALYGEITIEDGKVQQSNFHDYLMLRMDAAPEIEVHIVDSTEPPQGVGEPGVPPIAPAVANAIFAATGKRIRKLPIRI